MRHLELRTARERIIAAEVRKLELRRAQHAGASRRMTTTRTTELAAKPRDGFNGCGVA
jgi:hypothetical protein